MRLLRLILGLFLLKVSPFDQLRGLGLRETLKSKAVIKRALTKNRYIFCLMVFRTSGFVFMMQAH